MLKLLNNINRKSKGLVRRQFSSEPIEAGFDLLQAKKDNRQSKILKTKPKDEPDYMRFFKSSEEILFDERIHYNINQTALFVSRVVYSDFFDDSARLRNLRLTNVTENYFFKIQNYIIENKGALYLDIEGFSCLRILLLSKLSKNLILPELLFTCNPHIFEKFEEYSIARQMDIIIVMSSVEKHSERYVRFVIESLKEKIASGEIWKELTYYWDYCSIIQFLSVYLPNYIQEHEIKELYTPSFLNELRSKIDANFTKLDDKIIIFNFLDRLVKVDKFNYIMFNFLRSLYLDW